MKRNLLLMTAMLISACAMAQTFTRVYEAPQKPAYAPAGTFAPEDTIYLWNDKYGGFYTNHRGPQSGWPYGTRASVNDTIGSKIVFTQTNPATGTTSAEEEARKADEAFFAENPDAYLLVSYVSKFDGYFCTFADYFDGIWTDNNTTHNRYFTVEQVDNFVRIHPTADDYNELSVEWDVYSFCARAPEADGNWRCVFFNLEGEENEEGEWVNGLNPAEELGIDWAIITPETYDAWYEATKETNAINGAAAELRKFIEDAIEYYGEDIRPLLAEQIAAYNDANSTVESLKAALAEAEEIQTAYGLNVATPDNPSNMTSKIVNPDFTNANLDGWSFDSSTGQGAAWSRGGTVADAAERYHINFDTYQDIEGLAEGVYMVLVDGFCRAGGAQEDFNAWKAGTGVNPVLYVGGESLGEFETPFKHASEGYLEEDPGFNNSSTVTYNGATYYIPNTMLSFVGYVEKAKAAGQTSPYNTAAYGAIGEGEKLRIGARDLNGANDWVIVDNFELYYLGKGLDAYLKWAEQINMPALEDVVGEKAYSTEVAAEYTATRNSLKNATTKDEVLNAAQNVIAISDKLGKSVELYEQFVAEVTGFDEWLNTSNPGESSELGRLEVYMKEEVGADDTDFNFPNGSAKLILDIENGAVEGTLNNEQMEAELAFIQQLKEDAMNAGMQKNMSLTFLITNPDFEEAGAKGWTMTNQTGNYNPFGGAYYYTEGGQNKVNHCAEVWNGNFDFYQDITSDLLQEGLYKVSVRAFQRRGGNAVAWPEYQNYRDGLTSEPKITTEVYLNEFSTPVANVMSRQYPEALTTAGPADYATGEGTYVVNNMVSASKAFTYSDEEVMEDGVTKLNFKQDVFGLITAETAGKLRLGIRSTWIQDDCWSLWDKFELTYMAKDAEGLRFVIHNYIDRGASLDPTAMGALDYDEWDTASAEAEECDDIDKGKEDSETLYNMLTDLVQKYQRCLASEAKFTEYANTIDALTELYYSDDAQAYLTEETMDEIDSFTADHDGVDNSNLDIETMDELIKQAEALMNKIRLEVSDEKAKEQEGWDNATVENPFNTELIVNPRYENKDQEGWSNTGSFNYLDNLCEVYQGTFDVYQDVGLPRAGYYMLTVRGFERCGLAAGDYELVASGKHGEATNMYLYAKAGEQTFQHHVQQLGEGAVTAAEQANFTGTWQTVGTSDAPLYVTDNMTGAASFIYYYQNDNNNLNPETGEVIDETAGYYYNPLYFNIEEPMTVRLGLTKPTRKQNGGDWAIWGDWKLWYFGADVPDAIDSMSADAVQQPVQRSVYTLSGAKVNSVQRGINIVKTVDAQGNVKVQKIFVK